MKRMLLAVLFGMAVGAGANELQLGARFMGLVAPSVSAQTGTATDRNGNAIQPGMYVYIPVLIESITPSLNPNLTSVTVETLPNVGSTDYEGLELIVYANHLIKP